MGEILNLSLGEIVLRQTISLGIVYGHLISSDGWSMFLPFFFFLICQSVSLFAILDIQINFLWVQLYLTLIFNPCFVFRMSAPFTKKDMIQISKVWQWKFKTLNIYEGFVHGQNGDLYDVLKRSPPVMKYFLT